MHLSSLSGEAHSVLHKFNLLFSGEAWLTRGSSEAAAVISNLLGPKVKAVCFTLSLQRAKPLNRGMPSSLLVSR